MPEIAEVELVRQGLEPLLGKKIAALHVHDPKLAGVAERDVVGRRIVALRRQGKLLGLELAGNEVLAFHLRMTGQLLLGKSEQPKARLSISCGRLVLSFCDTRRFGTVTLEAVERFGRGLGPDLFSPRLDATTLAVRAHSKRALKAVLLDQSVVAGAGNYVVDEALWRAKLSPEQQAATLNKGQWSLLLNALQAVAGEALERGGATFADYRQADGSSGQMQGFLDCYGRSGLPCRRCRTPLEKTVVAGRGTTFCPRCQRAPKA